MTIMKEKIKKEIRYPNLSTVLMIENYLKNNKDKPIKISKLKEKLSKKIMYSTLKLALDYLYVSGKIIYGPRGFQWTYEESKDIKNFLKDSHELKYIKK